MSFSKSKIVTAAISIVTADISIFGNGIFRRHIDCVC